MRIKIIICGLCLIAAEIANAQGANAGYPSVWAWQLSTPHRDIFFLGEMHQFVLTGDDKVDYKLGLDIGMLASEIWVESGEASPTKKYFTAPLSTRVASSTLMAIKNEISSMILPPKNVLHS